MVCQVGIAQQAVAEALSAPDADANVGRAAAIWKERADVVLAELEAYPCVRPDGGWSKALADQGIVTSPPSSGTNR